MKSEAKTFVITISVLAILLLMHFLPPLSVGDTRLRPVNILSDLIPDADEQVDVIPRPKPVTVNSDDTTQAYEEYRPEGVVMIDDYSGDQPGGMNHFYDMLCNVGNLDRPVRIAYFCDSFTEGDIYTSDIREQLQQQFGGCGAGWVDCYNIAGGPAVVVRSSGFTEYIVSGENFNSQKQGINQRYFTGGRNAVMSVTGSAAHTLACRWQTASFYCSASQPVTVEATLNGTEKQVQTSAAASGIQQLTFTGDMNKVSLKVTSAPEGSIFYGVALESPGGVAVDNLSVRGIPGFSIAAIPMSTLKDFAACRPYDLIVVHFGLNVEFKKESEKSYRVYIDHMKQAVEHLREAYPQASILISSVSDRDQRTADGIRTMHAIEQLSAYQQVLASESRVAYFNLFEAMGGKNSMQKLVEQGMARKDYTHVNFKGGKYLADRFCQSLMAGLENYKRKKKAGLIK